VAAILQVGSFAEYPVVAPHREMGDTFSNHAVTSRARVFLDGPRFAYGLNREGLAALLFGSPKPTEDAAGINLFVVVLRT
jgi:hypothetical protein